MKKTIEDLRAQDWQGRITFWEFICVYLRGWWERHICADYPYDDRM